MIRPIILLFTVAMLLIYLVQARLAKSKVEHNDPDRFFLSTKSHPTEEYGSAQIAYALQMATVYPFFIFGFTGMWWLALWNTLFYAIGIWFFIVLLPRFTRGSLDLVGRASTPHALISGAHSEPNLRVFASALTMIGFTGLTLFETVWGTSALQSVLGGSSFLYYLSILIFALYLITILWVGGQRAEIKTGQWQLIVSYIGLHLLTAWTIHYHAKTLSNVNAPFVFPLIFILASWATLRRLWKWRQSTNLTLKFLNSLAICSFAIVIVAICTTPGFVGPDSWDISRSVVPKEWPWMLFTMGCLPLFFQFVDLTNWQRMSAISTSPDRVIKETKRGLRYFLMESPLSWLFPIGIGAAATRVVSVPEGQDQWMAFIGVVTHSTGGIDGTIAVFTVVGMVCVFLSTADSLMTGVGYAFAYDVYPATRAIMDRIHHAQNGDVVLEKERELVTQAGKIGTSVMIGVAASLYVGFEIYSSELANSFLGIFLTFYAPMLAFAPSILMPVIFGKTAPSKVALMSMGISAAVGIAIGFYSLINPAIIWQWVGVPACFILSWVIYLTGFVISPRPVRY